MVPQNAGVSISIVIPDTNEQAYLLDILRYPCHRDSVTVLDDTGSMVEEFYFGADGSIAFRVNTFDMDHSAAFDQEVVREYLLYINYLETHEIEVRYRLRKVGCSYDVFEYVEVYFDHTLYGRGEDVLEIPRVLVEQVALSYNPCP